jgi:hypothetical protein
MEEEAVSHYGIRTPLAARVLGFAPRFVQKNVLPLLHPRIRSLLQDAMFIRGAIAAVTVAASAATFHRLWFMRQVRDVEKDAKDEELPTVHQQADDSDTELWEVEEPEALTIVKDNRSEWESLHINELIAARTKNAHDIDL